MRNKSVEKKKAESLLMDNDKKREKVRRDVGRLEKDVADASKELQTMATPSKLFVALLIMVVMFGVNRRHDYNTKNQSNTHCASESCKRLNREYG